MSKELSTGHMAEIIINNKTGHRSLKSYKTGLKFCQCDGTASRVIACLNECEKFEKNVDPTYRREWHDIASATKWCALGALNKIVEKSTGINPEKG